jgi:pilus assembly protein CpaE
VLIDEHACAGDALLYLGLKKHEYNFFELASNTDRLDRELLQGFLSHHASGLDVVDSPDGVEFLQNVPFSAIESTIDFLRSQYECVVIDCPPGLSQFTTATLRQSDEVMLVTTAELAALRNLVSYLEFLGRSEYPSEHVHVVLNRHSKRSGIADDQIEKAIRKRIGLRVPNDYPAIARAVNTGTPVALDRRSEFAAALEHWAKMVVPMANGSTPNGRAGFSLANRLFAMKKAVAK